MNTTTIDRLLLAVADGCEMALSRMIEKAYESFRWRTRQMLADYPGLRSIHETDDIVHEAAIRLCRALRDVTPESSLHFFRLAGLQIRRTLLDLVRNLHRVHSCVELEDIYRSRETGDDEGDSAIEGPVSLSEWTEFHDRVGQLPETDRTTFDLLWYSNLTQTEVGVLLGVDVRTVQRRWQSARLALSDVFWTVQTE